MAVLVTPPSVEFCSKIEMRLEFSQLWRAISLSVLILCARNFTSIIYLWCRFRIWSQNSCHTYILIAIAIQSWPQMKAKFAKSVTLGLYKSDNVCNFCRLSTYSDIMHVAVWNKTFGSFIKWLEFSYQYLKVERKFIRTRFLPNFTHLATHVVSWADPSNLCHL